MINGDRKEFVEGSYYGDERFFYLGNVEYFKDILQRGNLCLNSTFVNYSAIELPEHRG